MNPLTIVQVPKKERASSLPKKREGEFTIGNLARVNKSDVKFCHFDNIFIFCQTFTSNAFFLIVANISPSLIEHSPSVAEILSKKSAVFESSPKE